MSDLISRAEAIDACCRGWNNTIEDCIRNIKEIPSAWYKGMECAQDIISAQPSAGTSSDLISRSDAICEVLVNDGIDNIVDRINALPSAEAEWIPCSERLPSEDGVYLIQKNWMLYGVPDMDVYHWAEGWNCYRGSDGTVNREYEIEDIIAWMPLPKPWKGADDE